MRSIVYWRRRMWLHNNPRTATPRHAGVLRTHVEKPEAGIAHVNTRVLTYTSRIKHTLGVSGIPKTSQLQIRVAPAQKAELARRARAEGMDLSTWVLSRLLPQSRLRFVDLVRALAREPSSFVLAEIHDFLESLGRGDFATALEVLPTSKLDAVSANQLAAMVETRAARLRVRPPEWASEILPLEQPWFATTLLSLRLHLLCNAPAAFRRRNLFVDSTLGDRV